MSTGCAGCGMSLGGCSCASCGVCQALTFSDEGQTVHKCWYHSDVVLDRLVPKFGCDDAGYWPDEPRGVHTGVLLSAEPKRAPAPIREQSTSATSATRR